MARSISLSTQSFMLSVPVFFLSLFVFPDFLRGDQEFYRRFYSDVVGLSLRDAYYFYKNSLGTSEPGYFIIIYGVAEFFNKDLFLSLINFFLAYFIFLWMLNVRARWFIVFSLYFNFYFLVLLFSAERLKFSLLIFMAAGSSSGVLRYVLYSCTLLFHIQTFFLLIAAQSGRAVGLIKKVAKGYVGYDVIPLTVVICLSFFTFFFLWGHIEGKLSSYEAQGGVKALLKPLIFVTLILYYAGKDWAEALFMCLPIVVFSFFVGSERLVIFLYFICMYYGVQKNRGLNMICVTSSIYFLFKGMLFVYNVFEYSDGFAGTSVEFLSGSY